MKPRTFASRTVLSATVVGALVGLLFPVSAATFELGLGLTKLNFMDLFFGSPTDVVVLFSPVVVALAGYLVGTGRRQVELKIAQLNDDRERLYNEVQAHHAVIEAAGKTQRAILDHLQSGICTVDASLSIDASYNSAFSRMFGPADLAGRSIADIVFGAWTERQKAELREAVALAFSNTASSDDMLNDILPSREIVHVGAAGSGGEVKYIHASLTRMFGSTGVEKIMFIFDDQTLARRLKEEEQRHQLQIDDQHKRIRQLLRHDRPVVYGFLSTFGAAVDRLSALFASLSQGAVNRQPVLDAAGMVHTIKGEAFSLDFDSCAEKAKALETYLKSIADTALGLEQHLQIIQLFESLADERRLFERMIGRMADLAGAAAGPAPAAAGPTGGQDAAAEALSSLEQPLSLVCKRSAEELGKRAHLTFQGISDRVPRPVFASLKESLLHLVRNSVAHGIERPEDRRARGKPESGTVSVSVKRSGGRLSIEYQDDGQGFDTESIRRALVTRGLMSAEAAQALTTSEVIRQVFVDGFSTKSATGMVAGQGMGMSVVRRAIMGDLGGSMQLVQKPGRGMGCRMSIPDPAMEAHK